MAGLALRRLPKELERFVLDPIPGCSIRIAGGELRSLPVTLVFSVNKPAILEGTVYAGEVRTWARKIGGVTAAYSRGRL